MSSEGLLALSIAAGSQLNQTALWIGLALAVLAAGTVWWQSLVGKRTHLIERGALSNLHAGHQRDADQLTDLALQRDHLDSILHAVPLPMLVCAPDGSIERGNQPLAAALARPLDDLPGRAFEDLFTQPELLALFETARRGSPGSGRIKLLTGSAPRWFDVACVPLAPAQAPTGIVMTLTDVTDLAVAVQLKADFAANAGHELRTPVAAIRGAGETLEAAADDPAMSARLQQIIASNVARLEALLVDLLDLARLESPEPAARHEPLSATDLCVDLREQFAAALAERALTLKINLDPALDRMSTDPLLIEMILRNLIDNAIKFARPGTAIKLAGRAENITPDKTASWQASAQDTSLLGARFTVADKGTGIPLPDQQRIFERFYQVDPSRDGHNQRRGTGLGLAIVKHALARLGGRISVASVWQQGTTMSFEIPHCVEAADGPPQ